MDEKRLMDGLVKLFLLPDKSSKGKRKTAVVKSSLNPIWEETFMYEKVSLEELSSKRVLEITVWNNDKGSIKDEFVGGLRIGPSVRMAKIHKEWIDSNEEEVSHWEEMLAHPGEWVERCHSLRSSMDPRDVDPTTASTVLRGESQNSLSDKGTPDEDRISLALEEVEQTFNKVSIKPKELQARNQVCIINSHHSLK